MHTAGIRNRTMLGSLLVAGALAGCGDDEALTMELLLGHESDTLSRDPAVTRVDVTAASLVTDFAAVASAPPGGELDFGEVPSDEVYEVSAAGFAGEQRAVGGRTLPGLSLTPGSMVRLFLQRLGTWARPPDQLPASRSGGAVSAVGERYVLHAGGTAEGDANPRGMELYDLLSLEGAASPSLPRLPASIVERASVLLLLGEGNATWLDLGSGAIGEPQLPLGLDSFEDVEGGAVIEGQGATFVVGATRASPPTAAILRVDSVGALALHLLSAPRAGASATWVHDLGLVVAGGSTEAAGVEVVRLGQAQGKPLDFPPDATVSAGASVHEDGRVLLFGGELDGASAPTRLVDPFCGSSCSAEVLQAAEAPALLHVTSQWNIQPGIALAIAEDVSAPATRTFRIDIDAGALEELPLREPRSGARAVPTPHGCLMLLGGRLLDGQPALRPELFFVE